VLVFFWDVLFIYYSKFSLSFKDKSLFSIFVFVRSSLVRLFYIFKLAYFSILGDTCFDFVSSSILSKEKFFFFFFLDEIFFILSKEDFASLLFWVSIDLNGEDFLEFDFDLLFMISPYIYILWYYLLNIVSENCEIL